MSADVRHYYLQQMQIEPWVLRKNTLNKKSLEQVASDVSICTRCPLCKSRTQTVFARGNPKAKLMVIGEAPGFYEDKQGLPFVGKAGGLLNNMLSSIGLTAEDVYIANLIKCRPPDNRNPKSEEIAACSPYLAEQIMLVAPRLIVALGRFAGQFLLNTTAPLNKMRHQQQVYQGIPVLVSYHPAYLLRNPADKKQAYVDLLRASQVISKV